MDEFSDGKAIFSNKMTKEDVNRENAQQQKEDIEHQKKQIDEHAEEIKRQQELIEKRLRGE